MLRLRVKQVLGQGSEVDEGTYVEADYGISGEITRKQEGICNCWKLRFTIWFDTLKRYPAYEDLPPRKRTWVDTRLHWREWYPREGTSGVGLKVRDRSLRPDGNPVIQKVTIKLAMHWWVYCHPGERLGDMITDGPYYDPAVVAYKTASWDEGEDRPAFTDSEETWYGAGENFGSIIQDHKGLHHRGWNAGGEAR
jgi:hypothetical protein